MRRERVSGEMRRAGRRSCGFDGPSRHGVRSAPRRCGDALQCGTAKSISTLLTRKLSSTARGPGLVFVRGPCQAFFEQRERAFDEVAAGHLDLIGSEAAHAGPWVEVQSTRRC